MKRSTFVVLKLILISMSVLRNAVAYFPPEARYSNEYQYIRPQFHPFNRNVMPHGYAMTQERMIPQEEMEAHENLQPILHTNPGYPVPSVVPDRPMLNYTGNEVPRLDEEDIFRSAKSGYEYPAHAAAPYPQAPSYGYSSLAPNYSAHAPAPAAPGYVPPTSKIPILKPDLTSLIKPVTTKVASKVSGLIGLVLTLLTGTAPDDLEMRGFKDIVINGIVKPLLIAKGGIKSLISKLTIPVISLLLINLEVLITVWWLWEECPEPLKPTYEYAKPTETPNYNPYR